MEYKTRDTRQDDEYFISSDETNIPTVFFKKFNKIETITIKDVKFQNKYWSMSLFSLSVSLIPQSTIKKLVIIIISIIEFQEVTV